jgi:hypothetical protein
VPDLPEGQGLKWLGAVQGLTLGNVLVLALLAVIAVPVYVIYRALGDEKIMDRLMSTYEVIDSRQGCAVRHVQERGGPDLWGVSSGFAFQGRDRWFVNVLLDHAPTDDEVGSYCESLKLIADRLLDHDGERGSEIHGGSVPGAAPDRGRHDRLVPSTETQTEEAQ